MHLQTLRNQVSNYEDSLKEWHIYEKLIIYRGVLKSNTPECLTSEKHKKPSDSTMSKCQACQQIPSRKFLGWKITLLLRKMICFDIFLVPCVFKLLARTPVKILKNKLVSRCLLSNQIIWDLKYLPKCHWECCRKKQTKLESAFNANLTNCNRETAQLSASDMFSLNSKSIYSKT